MNTTTDLKVIGIDLSLTSTGLAIVYGTTIETSCIKSEAPTTPRHPRTGKPLPPTLAQRQHRLYDIAAQVLLTVEGVDPDLTCIEQPAFSKNQGSAHDRSGLWWLIVNSLHLDRRMVVEITPNQRAKYATGKGTAGKDKVLLAVDRRYPDVNVAGNDEADALVLAAMGCRWLGQPIDTMPKPNLEAMDTVTWPAPAAVAA